MFKARFWSSVVIVAVILLFGFAGGPFLALFLGVISCIGYLEFTKATKVRPNPDKISGFEKIGLTGIILYYLLLLVTDDALPFRETFTGWLFKTQGDFNYFTVLVLFIFVLSVVSMFMVYIFTFPRHNITQITHAAFGLIYVAMTLSFIYYIRELPNGIYLMWLVFMSSWVCDTCAYVVGMLFGKHKLTLKLSPKKSVEGAIGGVVGSALAGGLFGWLYAACTDSSYGIIAVFAIICCVGSVVSQCGDLTASAIKRNYDIKDYGKIIPGHGGILDRFDSVIFTSPMVFFLVMLMMQFN